VAVVAGSICLLPPASATAKGSTSVAVTAEYRKVLLAEFFGPARDVCSQLTSAGIRAYTGGSHGCASVFASDQRALALKLGGGKGSAVARSEWRKEVGTAVAHLKVKIHDRRATAIDGSGLFRRTELVEVGGHWKFTSAPPLPRS
jgi:hypothetical protein